MHSSLRLEWCSPMDPEIARQRLPNSPGIYAWNMATNYFSGFDPWPSQLTEVAAGDVVYVGLATSLRRRAPHQSKQSSNSSFRRNLAGIFGLQAVWGGTGKAAHPRLVAKDEAWLDDWMNNNLQVSWAPTEVEPGETIGRTLRATEETYRKMLTPPFNLDGLTRVQLYVARMQRTLVAHATPAPEQEISNK